MKTLKTKTYILILVALAALISSCATSSDDNGISYKNGYYITSINYSFDDVYSASRTAIESGQTFDIDGNPYKLVTNKRVGDEAVLKAVGKSDPSDYVDVAMIKISDTSTKLYIRYGDKGDSIRSSGFISIIIGDMPKPNS